MRRSHPLMPRYYGSYGGRFVPETLMAALEELEAGFARWASDPDFQAELDGLLRRYAGRPTPLTRAENLSREADPRGRIRIYLKREDLLHTGAHKLNNALGQALLAKRLGKRRLIAETGAGQHGVAVATAGAKLGLPTEIYMGAVDMERQRPNVLRMRLLGATVIPVRTGSRTLKDAINEALRDWAATSESTHYLIGSVVGPHPYPAIVAHFQAVIGREARAQLLEAEGRLPDAAIACVGGGSNALGLFRAFLEDPVELIGVEAGGRGARSGTGAGEHAARFGTPQGSPGVLHGTRTYLLQDEHGQVLPTHSIAAGLDYPAVGPEHAFLRETGRARYMTATDREALEAFRTLARSEGILPALESAHAVAYALRRARTRTGTSASAPAPQREHPEEEILLVNLSGRGDKDLSEVEKLLDGTL